MTRISKSVLTAAGGKRWDATKLDDVMATEIFETRHPGMRFVSWREFGSTHATNEKELLASLPQRFKELGVDAAISSMAC